MNVAKALRSELAALDLEIAIMRPWTMEEIVEDAVATRRFQMSLALTFAVCGLFLASLGVYGLIRTRSREGRLRSVSE